MVRVIVALFVLGIGAIAWVLLLPSKTVKQPQGTAIAAQPQLAEATVSTPALPPARAARDVRVVYAGPTVGAPVRKLSDKVEDDVPAPPAAASPVAAADQAPASTVVAAAPSLPDAPAPATPAAPALVPAPPAGAAININTASVEALNQIPGAGRIGRTIASHRPYASIDELVRKRVIRKSVYDKIKYQIAAN